MIVVALCSIFFSHVAVTETPEYSVARGGRLYDKWFKVKEYGNPDTDYPAYPNGAFYKGRKGSDWRCKECHGWDYLGEKGDYAQGKHHTGFKGISAMRGADTASITALLLNETHSPITNTLCQQDINDLVSFIRKGQVDMDSYIDRQTKRAKGDAVEGRLYYEMLCAVCHGLDGKQNDEMYPMGYSTSDNPWKALHTILNGRAGGKMGALRILDMEIIVDILSYAQTLPKE